MSPTQSIARLVDSPEELRARLAGLDRLLDVSVRLAAEIDLETILSTVTHEACLALECDRATLWRYDPKSEELYTSVATALEVQEIRNPLNRGITGHVATHRVVANVPDPPLDPRWNSAVDRETGYHTRSILAAPLTSPHDERLLGVLQLLNKDSGAFDAFDEELIQAFSQHAAIALDRARLVEELRRHDAMHLSLAVARDIQRGFMPSRLPAIPGYEADTWWFPNEAIGGDYCDVLKLPDGRTGLVIADVSGHGIGPSLIMASVRAALRALALERSDPGALLNALARALVDDLQDGRFITMVLAALDYEAHQVTFANAGHAPALHFKAATGEFDEMRSTGMPLGVLDDPHYPCGPTISLAPGDILFLCTDGIVEAMDQEDRFFGQDRLESLIRLHAHEPLARMVEQVGKEVVAHFAGDHPPDDLTILAVRRSTDAR
jgi:sigma-B regulation protein RsbU (phosphoserine phosphatase)